MVAAALGWRARQLARRLEQSERDRRRAADELNRRLSELFSLQELSYILSGSLQLDRIVEQVVRYAMRFLEAKGALVALAADGEAPADAERRPLTVAAAEGTLGRLRGETIGAGDVQGSTRRANRSLAAMLGSAIPSVIGRDLGTALLGESPALVELLAAARRGDRAQPLVLRSAPLGRTLRVNAARIPSPEQEASVVVLVEDVTDQQHMESQLIQSEKLAAVGQLVSGVAHELNNPLTSIAGLSEFLLEQKELGSKDRGHLPVIHEQAQRAGRIVRNLLTFARKGPAEQGRVDLNDVLQRTILLMAHDLKLKDITVEKVLPTIPEILGDRHALQQAVLNLLNNAAQAVAENKPGRRRLICVNTWSDQRVRMRLSDSGPGIPDDVVPQLS